MEATAYIDTHAHLSMLTHAPMPEILERAKLAHIGKMVNVSTDESNWKACHELALANDHIFSALGVHPHEAHKWKQWKPLLEKWFSNDIPPKKCVGIGETGLDFHYSLSPRQAQIESFEDQVRLAKRTSLPLIIHCRNAFPELFASLKAVGMGKRTGVLHCFTGTYEEAKKGLDFGLKISFSGILSFKNATDLRDTASKLPVSELLVETDCPYLAPIPFRGKPNEPSYLPETAKILAAQLKIGLPELADKLWATSIAFFGLN